jgi:hypothetical protein
MLRTVVETPDFIRDAADAGLTAEERGRIVALVAAFPTAGVEIPGTGGARKIRFPGRGKGNSGGYRVIAFPAGSDVPVFLLNVFAKGDKIDLTQAERNELRKELAGLAEDYRNGVRRHVEGW